MDVGLILDRLLSESGLVSLLLLAAVVVLWRRLVVEWAKREADEKMLVEALQESTKGQIQLAAMIKMYLERSE